MVRICPEVGMRDPPPPPSVPRHDRALAMIIERPRVLLVVI